MSRRLHDACGGPELEEPLPEPRDPAIDREWAAERVLRIELQEPSALSGQRGGSTQEKGEGGAGTQSSNEGITHGGEGTDGRGSRPECAALRPRECGPWKVNDSWAIADSIVVLELAGLHFLVSEMGETRRGLV